jgi:hypothetical protein
MTKLKACLLLFVMLMLPLRGAMAGMGLLCEHAPQPMQAAAQHAGHDHARHGVQHAAEDTRLVSAFAHHDHGDRSAPDTCNLCTSVCSTPPLASGAVQLPAPLDGGRPHFPPVDVARLSYVTDGLERPPRTI